MRFVMTLRAARKLKGNAMTTASNVPRMAMANVSPMEMA